ncbi:MAG: hypothetical protein ACK5DE_10785 [Bacteroidota bacterium]|jgi:hypothetical protein
MTNSEITQAILNLNPKAEFVLRGNDLAGLDWLGKDTAPTEAEIIAEIALLPAKAEAKKAAREAILAKLGITADELAAAIG